MKIITFALAILLYSFQVPAEEAVNVYPILAIQHSPNSDVLLRYKLNEHEKQLFKEIDSATATLPENTELSAYYKVAIGIGKRYGLTPNQSIAFFTRSTFSEFEP